MNSYDFLPKSLSKDNGAVLLVRTRDFPDIVKEWENGESVGIEYLERAEHPSLANEGSNALVCVFDDNIHLTVKSKLLSHSDDLESLRDELERSGSEVFDESSSSDYSLFSVNSTDFDRVVSIIENFLVSAGYKVTRNDLRGDINVDAEIRNYFTIVDRPDKASDLNDSSILNR